MTGTVSSRAAGTRMLAGSSAPKRPRHTLTGEFRMHRSFPSKFLGSRDVIVYLPPGYAREPRRRYPVVYMHDGQNLFDGATAFTTGQEWRADETAESLIATGAIEPLLIVGIYNTGEARVDEYTPVYDASMRAGGKADLYARLLIEELKPFVDATYRTLGGAEHTGVAGSSLGGLVSLYLALAYPETFGKAGVMSPSVWWGDRAVLRAVEALERTPPLRIWLDTGTNEGTNALEGVRLLRDTLEAKGFRDLAYLEIEGAPHNESAWAERVGAVLRFLFPARPRVHRKSMVAEHGVGRRP